MNFDEIRKDYENGLSVKELSEKYKVKVSTINGRIDRHGWLRRPTCKQTWTRDKYNLGRKELVEAVNVAIQYITNSNEYEFHTYMKKAYPNKRLSYKTINRIKELARNRIQRRIEINLDSAIKEYLIKLDRLYILSLESGDIKTSLDVLKERAKLIDLYPIPKSKMTITSEFDIEKFTEKQLEKFSIANQEYENIKSLKDIEI